MDNEFNQKVERQIGAELRRLGDVPAPRTLVPHVIEVIQSRQREAWWSQPWPFWPRTVQVLSALVLAVALGAAWYASRGVWDVFQGSGYWAQVSRWFGLVALIADSLVALGRGMVLAGQSAGQQFLVYGLAVCLAMYAACVGFGTLFYRMVSTPVKDS